MFFGALLSAILSTASGALLAPTALFTENVLKRLYPHMGDRQFLFTLRLVLVIFTLAVVTFALTSDASIYQMVQNTYKVTLVSCIVPLVAGIYWSRATAQGALLSIALGLVSWIGMEIFAADGVLPPQLVGLALSIAGMVAGSYASRAPHHALHQSEREESRESQSRYCIRARQAARDRAGRPRGPAGRRGPGRTEGDRRVPHRRVHPLRRRPGGPVSRDPRPRGRRRRRRGWPRRDDARSRRPRHPALHPRVPAVQGLPLAEDQPLHRDPRHPGQGRDARRHEPVLAQGQAGTPLHGLLDFRQPHRAARDRAGEDPERRARSTRSATSAAA